MSNLVSSLALWVPKRVRAVCILTITILLTGLTTFTKSAERKPPPASRRGDVVDDYHGVKVPDPYQWLEDQKSPETRAWIDAQNAYTRSFLDALPGRDKIAKRLGELMKVDVTGLPRVRNGRYFFSKRRADQDLYVIYMREGAQGKDEALIDPHGWSADHSTSVVLRDVSRDGKLMVFGSDDEVVRLVEPGKPGQKQLRQFPQADPETYERDRHHGPVSSPTARWSSAISAAPT